MLTFDYQFIDRGEIHVRDESGKHTILRAKVASDRLDRERFELLVITAYQMGKRAKARMIAKAMSE